MRTTLRALMIAAFSSLLLMPQIVQAANNHAPANTEKTHHVNMRGAVKVTLHRATCSTVSTATEKSGSARIKIGKHGGAQIKVSVRHAMPDTRYRAYVLNASNCSVLHKGGVLTTNRLGNGNIHVHVRAGTIPTGTTHLAVQLVSPADATIPTGPFTDVITSSQT